MSILEVAIDCFLTLLAIGLFIIEIFSAMPIIIGFLRFRCFIKFPFAYSLMVSHCQKRVIIYTYNDTYRAHMWVQVLTNLSGWMVVSSKPTRTKYFIYWSAVCHSWTRIARWSTISIGVCMWSRMISSKFQTACKVKPWILLDLRREGLEDFQKPSAHWTSMKMSTPLSSIIGYLNAWMALCWLEMVESTELRSACYLCSTAAPWCQHPS